MYKARVDKNQKEIVEAYRRHGAKVKHVHTLKNLFDILVYFNGKTYSVEIKADKSKKLTKGELECKKDLESVDVTYHIVYDVKSALEILK